MSSTHPSIVKGLSIFLLLAFFSSSPAISLVQAKSRKAESQPTSSSKPFLPPTSEMVDFLPQDDGLQQGNIDSEQETVIGLTSINRTPGVQLRGKVDRLDGPLAPKTVAPSGQEALRQAQQQVEAQDLTHLWNAAIERNAVIRFSLEKLALPQDLQASHSSQFLRKTLSVLISGAAIGASMMTGASAGYQNMGIMASSQALDNMVRGTNKPVSNLTPTEHIQLADLVDQMKVQLVDNYNQLNGGLQLLQGASTRALKANESYSEALTHPNQPVEQLTHAVAYYQALMDEMRLSQQVSLAQVQLARIAGKDAINEAQLTLAPAVSVPLATEKKAEPVARVAVSPVVAPVSKPAVQLPAKPPEAITPSADKSLVAMAAPPIVAASSPAMLALPAALPSGRHDPFHPQVIIEYAP